MKIIALKINSLMCTSFLSLTTTRGWDVLKFYFNRSLLHHIIVYIAIIILHIINIDQKLYVMVASTLMEEGLGYLNSQKKREFIFEVLNGLKFQYLNPP